MDILPVKMTTNSDDKNVRYKMDCYTLHTFLLVIILFFVIAIIAMTSLHLKNLILIIF